MDVMTQLGQAPAGASAVSPVALDSWLAAESARRLGDEAASSERIAALMAVPLLRQLPVETLLSLATAAQLRHYPVDTPVVSQGEDGSRGLFFVVEGDIEVLSRSPYGGHAEAAVGWLSTGDMIGAAAFFSEQPHLASCVTATRTTCLFFDRATVLGAVERNPELARGLLSTLAARLHRATSQQVEQLRDPLTGLPLSKLAVASYERELARMRRHAHPAHGRRGRRAADTLANAADESAPSLAVLVVHPEFGPLATTAFSGALEQPLVARDIAKLLTGAARRETDVVARYQDDQFVVLLPDVDIEGAQAVVDRIFGALAERSPDSPPLKLAIRLAMVDARKDWSFVEALARAKRATAGIKTAIAPGAAAPAE
jgi:CRP-like cAMP-binding protein